MEATANRDEVMLWQLVEDALKKQYPHGHKDFIALCLAEIKLHSAKNNDYAGGGRPMGNFERVGKIVGMYPRVNWSTPQNIAILYALKQLDAYLWLEHGDREGLVEGKEARLGDISVYMKLARLLLQDERRRLAEED